MQVRLLAVERVLEMSRIKCFPLPRQRNRSICFDFYIVPRLYPLLGEFDFKNLLEPLEEYNGFERELLDENLNLVFSFLFFYFFLSAPMTHGQSFVGTVRLTKFNGHMIH